MNGDKPVSPVDAAALIHDIEYLKGDFQKADENMAKNVANNLKNPTAYLGIKFIFGVKDIFGYDPIINPDMYNYLKNKVRENDLLANYKDMQFYESD